MPTTRSQRQPTLQFPKRKSSRVSSQPKNSAQPGSEHVLVPRTVPLSPRKRSVGVPLSPMKAVVDVRDMPLSPTRTNVTETRAFPLSPRHHMPRSISPSERLPLSPRKRTGILTSVHLYSSCWHFKEMMKNTNWPILSPLLSQVTRTDATCHCLFKVLHLNTAVPH